MATKFDVHVIVPAKLIGTLVELLEGEGCLVSMEPYVEKVGIKKPKFAYAGGKRNKGISGYDAVIEAIKVGYRTTEKIADHMVKEYGFAPTSASPAITHLKAAGRIKQDEDSKIWSLTK